MKYIVFLPLIAMFTLMVLGTALPTTASAQSDDSKRDRIEDVRDHRENIRDRNENRRDRRENRRDRND